MSYTTENQAHVEDYTVQLRNTTYWHGDGRYGRTLFIGLGGAGKKSLLHLRSLFLERYGVARLPGTAFLAIDTDVSAVLGFQPKANYTEDETIHLKADIAKIMDSPEEYPQIYQWLDPQLSIGEGFEIAFGAGMIRQVGRLGLFASAEHIVNKIQAQLNTILNLREESDRLLPDGLEVHIVSSLAGGTGSGILFDIAAMIKTINPNAAVMGHCIMPDCFKSLGNYAKLAANGAAALRELNHYVNNSFETQWTDSLRTPVEGIRGLFNQVYLQGAVNTQNVAIDNNNSHLPYQNIGEALFLRYSMGSMPGFIKSVRINRVPYMMQKIAEHYHHMDQGNDQRDLISMQSWKTYFSSFGIAKLVYPSWRLFHYARFDLTSKVLDFYNPNIPKTVDTDISTIRNRILIELGVFQGTHSENDDNKQYLNVDNRLMVLESFEPNTGDLDRSIVGYIDYKLWGQSLAASQERIGSVLDIALEQFEMIKSNVSATIEANVKDVCASIDQSFTSILEDCYATYGFNTLYQVLQAISDALTHNNIELFQYISFMKHAETLEQTNIDQSKATLTAYVAEILSAESSEENHSDVQIIEKLKHHVQHCVQSIHNAECIKGAGMVLRHLNEKITKELLMVDTIGQTLTDLSAHMQYTRDGFKSPKTTGSCVELSTSIEPKQLLSPFLGTTNPNIRLQHYVNNRLSSKLGLDTLEGLRNAFQDENSIAKLKTQLELLLYQDLKGFNGKTNAFATKDQLANEDYVGASSFLEHYSLERELLDGNALSEIKDLLTNTMKTAQPWVKETPHHPSIVMKQETDVFVSIPQETSAPGAERRWNNVKDAIRNIGSQNGVRIENFIPSREGSEIIIYAEQTAFPIFYHQEISRNHPNSFLHFYEKLQNNTNNPTVLHLFRDYHSYTPLEPFHPSEQAMREEVCESLLKAQMLGIIQTGPQSTEGSSDSDIQSLPTDPIGYVYPAENDDDTLTFTSNERLLHHFTSDKRSLHQLNSAINDKEEQLVSNRGSYAHLYALADYWYHIIYPVTFTDIMTEARQGSLQNKVLMNIRKSYMEKSLSATEGLDRFLRDRDAVYNRVEGLVHQLTSWTRPNAKREQTPLLMKTPLDQNLQSSLWDYGSGNLVETVKEIATYYSDQKWTPSPNQEPACLLPALQIDWDKFIAHAQEAFVATPSKRSLDDLVQQLHANQNAGQIISIDNGKTWNLWTTFPWLVEKVNTFTPKEDVKPTNPFDR